MDPKSELWGQTDLTEDNRLDKINNSGVARGTVPLSHILLHYSIFKKNLKQPHKIS